MSDTLAEERRNDTRRIQFEFSADAFDRLTRMKDQTEAGSYAEVARDDVLAKTIKFVL